MSMIGTTIINRPIEVVFEYVNDLSHDAEWRNGLDESGWVNDGQEIKVGAVGYTLAAGGRFEWRVLTYIPNERVDWEFISGLFEGRAGYRFKQVDGGTEFTLVADIKPTNWFKYLGPIFSWIGQRQNQADVEKLKAILEAMPEA